MANETPLEKMVPSAETELLVHGRSNGVEPFEQAISLSDSTHEGEGLIVYAVDGTDGNVDEV